LLVSPVASGIPHPPSHCYVSDLHSRIGTERQLQVTASGESGLKYRLLKRPEAENNRRRLVELIENLARVFEGSLFGCSTKELRETLEGELEGRPSCDGIVWMHFGAERGLNAAEGCRAGVVVGREQPSARAVEEVARAFAAASPEPFASLVDEVDGQPVEKPLPRAVRPRLTRDAGSTVAAELTTHPDPWGRAVLEQVREAGVVQAAGRMRMVRREGKFLVLATSLPAAVEVGRLVTQHELEQAAKLAAEAVDGLARHGAHVVAASREEGRRAERLGPLVGLAAELLGAGGGFAHDRIRVLLRSRAKPSAHEARLPAGPKGGRPGTAWVLSALPPAAAFAAARAAGWSVVPATPLPHEPAPPPPAPEVYVVFRADGTTAPLRPVPVPNPRDERDWLAGTPIAEIDRRHRAALLAQGFSG
jgi:hypothetical protein